MIPRLHFSHAVHILSFTPIKPISTTPLPLIQPIHHPLSSQPLPYPYSFILSYFPLSISSTHSLHTRHYLYPHPYSAYPYSHITTFHLSTPHVIFQPPWTRFLHLCMGCEEGHEEAEGYGIIKNNGNLYANICLIRHRLRWSQEKHSGMTNAFASPILHPCQICRQLASLHEFSIVDLSCNLLTGPIPKKLSNLSSFNVTSSSLLLIPWYSPSCMETMQARSPFPIPIFSLNLSTHSTNPLPVSAHAWLSKTP